MTTHVNRGKGTLPEPCDGGRRGLWDVIALAGRLANSTDTPAR